MARTGVALLVVSSLLLSLSLAISIPHEEPISINEKFSSEEILAYWTPERMRAAKPKEHTVKGDFNASKYIEDFEPENAGGYDAMPPASWKNEGESGNETEGVNAPLYPCSYTKAYSTIYNAYPWITVGKVFFTMGGVNYVCSGSSVCTHGIVTAGHCVYDPDIGQYASRFVFVPAYNNGNEPYGRFAANSFHTTPGWVNSGSFCGDYAFVTTCKNSAGTPVGTAVGTLGVVWGLPTSQTWRSLGYPAASPFNGQRNYWTQGPYCDSASGCTPAPRSIGSDATGGTSGGPWVIGWSTSNPQVNSVNSFKYNNQPNAIYGPYFNSAVNTYFQRACPAQFNTC